jgi:hypothetical protein
MGGRLMAEVVKVPVVGNVKKPWLYAGAAASAGIVGYAWWTRGALVEDETTDIELPESEYEPPTVVDSGISVGQPQQGEPIARTNVEWATMAREQGAAFGASDALINSALSKYLGKDRLSVAEAALVAAIVAVLGEPPTGRPFPILPAPVEPPPSHPTGMQAPVLTRTMPVYRNGAYEYTISWLPIPGAVRYYFEHVGGSTGHLTTTKTNVIRAAPGRVDTWRFAGVAADNTRGPVATMAVTLPAAPGGTAPAPSSGKPGVPGFVSLTKTGRSTYNVNFVVPRGASYYKYRRIDIHGRRSAWAYGRPTIGTGRYAGTAHIKARALFRTRTAFSAEIVACNARGCSAASRSSNRITLP